MIPVKSAVIGRLQLRMRNDSEHNHAAVGGHHASDRRNIRYFRLSRGKNIIVRQLNAFCLYLNALL